MDQRKISITPMPGHLVKDDKGERITSKTEVTWGMRYARLELQGSIEREKSPDSSKVKRAKRKTQRSAKTNED